MNNRLMLVLISILIIVPFVQGTTQGGVGAETQALGGLFGFSNPNDVQLKSVNYEVTAEGVSTLSFQESGEIILRQNDKQTKFQNIKSNAQGNSFIKLNKEGTIIEADITTISGTSVVIGNNNVFLPPNSQLVYKNNIITINAPNGAVFEGPPSIINNKKPSNVIQIHGSNLQFPEFTLQDGTLNYKQGIPFIAKGASAKILPRFGLGEYTIHTADQDVLFGFGGSSKFSDSDNYAQFLKNKVVVNGNGFEVNFNLSPDEESSTSLIALPAAGYYRQGYKPANSLETKSIQSIQNLVGVSETGVYDRATFIKVKSWQEEVFRKTGTCLGKETGNTCVGDGLFGELSRGYVTGGAISLSPQGGQAEFGIDSLGVFGGFTGAAALRFGDTRLTSDGTQINREIFSSVLNQKLSLPGRFTFLDSSGRKITEIKTEGSTIFYGKNLQNKEALIHTLATEGVNPGAAQCAKTICVLFDKQIPSGQRAGSLLDPSLSAFAGLEGQAWEISHNIQKHRGELVYSAEKSLPQEQREALSALREEAAQKYALLISNGVESTQAIKQVSDTLRQREAAILNTNSFNSPVGMQTNDVVGLYYRDSGYLAEAIMNGGKDDGFSHKNTHVALVTGSSESTLQISGDPILQLKRALKVSSDSSLYVNQYFVRPKGTQAFEPAFLRDGKFYSQDSSEITIENGDSVRIVRPNITHMIHYTKGEENPFHIEPLDTVIDRDDLALYSVTRPNEEISDRILTARKTKASEALTLTQEKNCQDPSCSELSVTERAQYYGVNNNVVSYVAKVKPPRGNQEELYRAALLAAYQMESGQPLQYSTHKVEEFIYSSIGIKDYSRGTFVQIKPSTLQEAGKILGKDVRGLDLTTDEGSLKAGELLMEAIFKKYIPPSKKSLSDKDVELIAAAWNVGINAEYTQKLAKGDYNNLPKIGISRGKLNGVVGTSLEEARAEFHESLAKLQGYYSEGYSSGYPKRYLEQYRRFLPT